MPSVNNAIRQAAIRIAQVYKDLFWMPWVPPGRRYRWLFRGQNGDVRVPGEMVLADLRDFCFAGPNDQTFDTDPLVMARRTGRREVFQRITSFLNLDESMVQQLMEIDDGIG